ncbi:MAG: hypothetical protein RLZZ221_2027, partial [Verrucomicrobiota bacterium]
MDLFSEPLSPEDLGVLEAKLGNGHLFERRKAFGDLARGACGG